MRSSAGASPSHHTLNQHCTKDVCTEYTFANLMDEAGISLLQVCSFCLLRSSDDLFHHTAISYWYSISFLWPLFMSVLSFAHSVSLRPTRCPAYPLPPQLGSFLKIDFYKCFLKIVLMWTIFKVFTEFYTTLLVLCFGTRSLRHVRS